MGDAGAGELRAFADGRIGAGARARPEHDEIAERRTAGDPALRDDNAMASDRNVVRDLNVIVDLGAFSDHRIADRAAVDRRSGSDLDIVLLGPARLSLGRLAALREAFAESELPIRIDVIDWHAISENFRNIIAAKFETLQTPALLDAESAKLEQAIKANLRGLGYGG